MMIQEPQHGTAVTAHPCNSPWRVAQRNGSAASGRRGGRCPPVRWVESPCRPRLLDYSSALRCRAAYTAASVRRARPILDSSDVT